MNPTNYNTFLQVLEQYNLRQNIGAVHTAILNQEETRAIIPTMDNLILAHWNDRERPKELTAKLEHNDMVFYIKADVEYYPLRSNRYNILVKQIWR